MDMTWFLIMVASPLVVLVSIFGMFVWGAKANPPSFIQEAEDNDKNN
ncbi:cytochrome bd oxidase small subunit CydS [Salipaludibacillus daqingensis]|nr:hypothetical protein [Salipaludibacillus daqingensis]